MAVRLGTAPYLRITMQPEKHREGPGEGAPNRDRPGNRPRPGPDPQTASTREELAALVAGQRNHLQTLQDQLAVSRKALRAVTEQLYETQSRLAQLESLGRIPLGVARKVRVLITRFPRLVATFKRVRRLVG